ncbi:hypothetical protein NP493_353g00003 [Ridgeia piscesae]|uniref:SGNH hydrolase-type esterase domain-containing protein n=1 Tax=Ridgeia piscesae TaxID=27915 RepID=A0AAD9NVH6_RIDPI|nr:hypothetical protein NP493_353g00003 [Ridgeia piscesae]
MSVPISPCKILVLGHSYVSWVGAFVRSAGPSLAGLFGDFEVAGRPCELAYEVIRGATVATLLSPTVMSRVVARCADIVVLHIGGNDICGRAASPPIMVALDLLRLARRLLEAGTRRVVVCQLVSFGRPPPQCDELQDFDTAPGLRAVVTDSALARSTWERDMERRVVSSERMLGEIHNLVLNLRPNPAVAAPSAALGSAVQSVSVDMPPGEGRHAVPPVTASAGHALPPFPDAPWPSVDTFFPGTEDTQTLLSSCNSTALPLGRPNSCMSSAPRSWLVITSTFPSFLSPPSSNPKNSLFPSTEAPVNPPSACPRPGPRMRSCLLINGGGPFNSTCPSTCCSRPTSHVLLKYMEVVRWLADAGGNWRSYDAAFRTLRGRCGWAWHSISWELWLKASQSQAGRRLAAGPPLSGQGRAGPDLRPPVRASRSTGASCAAVTPVGALTSAGSAVEPTLLSDALRPKPTGNPLAPPSHPQVPLVAPRLPVDSRMAQTINYHPQFHWLHYSTYYMVGEFHDLAHWANVNPVIVPYSMSPAGLGSL